MTNPKLTLFEFPGRAKKNVVRMTHTHDFYAEPGNVSMADTMRALRDQQKVSNTRRYWTFARYARNHIKDDIQDITAAAIQFPYTAKQELLDALEAFPYVFYLVHSQSSIDILNPSMSDERLVVVVPFVNPVTSPARYTRIVTLITQSLGLGDHADGDFSATFLFSPFYGLCSEPLVRTFDADREFLDADDFYEENKGVWTNGRAYQEGAALLPKPMKLDETGLFEFPK